MNSLFELAKNLIALLVAAWKRLRKSSAAKEDTIALKDATIEQKDATIEHLKKISSAPLATELQTVTATVNKYVGKSQELEVQLKTMKEQHKNVVGVVCFEAFLAIEEMRYAYQSAAGGFDALALPSKMRSLAEEFLEQGQQAFAGQAIQARRVREAMARQKS